MPAAKINALTDLAGAQSPADLVYIGKSPFGATDDRKSTLNDFFAYPTKSITDKALRFQGAAAPAVSGANEGAIYYDLAANEFKLSQNGGAYVDLYNPLAVAGVTGSVQINNGGGLLDGDAQFIYDPLTATVTIGSASLGGQLRLRALTSGNGVIIKVDAPAGNHTYVWPNALPTTTSQALTATGISGSTITLGWQAAGGTTINSTNEFLPYRLNATTFADSPLRRTGTQTVFVTDGVTNFVSLGTGGVQVYEDGSSTFPVINLNSAGGLYVTSTHPAIARAGSSHTVFTAGQTLSVQDGTVTAPSWSFNADANTGVYRSAADTFNIAVGGVNPFEIGTVYVALVSGATATELRLYEPSGSGTNYTAFKAQAQAANLTYTLPAADGSSNQALLTNGSGTLSWGSPTPGTFADGTAAAPSITFTADTNTGFYRPIAENISATAAGVGIASFTVDGMTVGFVDQFSFATLYVSGKNSSYPAAIIRSVDSPTTNILEVTRKVAVNDYDVLTVKAFGELMLVPRPRTGTATPYLQATTPEDATLTASTESTGIQMGGTTAAATVIRQWATGALTTQREVRFIAPTYSFAGASTISNAVGVEIASPIAGTNATFTISQALRLMPSAAAHLGLVIDHSTGASATGDLLRLNLNTTPIIRFVPVSGDVNSIFGDSALGTTATDGFVHYPSMAGVPTGVPTAYTGVVPTVVDTTNSRFYAYIGAAWVNLSGSGSISGSGAAGRAAFWTGASALSSNANYQWDDVNSRLSINQGASPSAPVHVKADASNLAYRVTANAAAINVDLSSDGTVGFLGTTTTHGFELWTDATTRIRIEAGGSIGINQAAPGAQLDIVSGAAGTVGLIVSSAASPSVNIVTVRQNATAVFQIVDSGGLIHSTQPRTSGSATFFRVQTPADTTLTASTEAIGLQFGGTSAAATVTRQFSTGALTTQRENVFVAPTYSFVGASTITTAATVAISGAPVAGTNATLTNRWALWVQAGDSKFVNDIYTDNKIWASNFINALSGVYVEGVYLRGVSSTLKISDGSTGGRPLSSVPLTPAQITADQNNYNPGIAWFYRLSSDASRNITGFSAGVDGQWITMWNVGAQNIVLQNENASSTAANRFHTSTGADLTLTPDKCAMAMYDNTTARWRIFLGN